MSSPRHGRFQRLILALLVFPLTTALSLPHAARSSPSALFARASDDKCPADNYSTCSPSLPDDFCCPTDSTCLVLAGNTTALCCPSDDCPRLATIPCDLSVQDVSKNPKAQIMTTVLDGELPACGKDTCCPYGYSCEKCDVDGDEVDCCIKKEDQDEKPTSTKTETTKTETKTTETAETTTKTKTTMTTDEATTTATGTPAATTTTGSTAQPTSGTSSDNDDDDNADERKKQSTSVGLIVGVFGGSVAALGLLGVSVFVYFRKHAADDDSVATKLFHKLQEFRGVIYSDEDDKNKKIYDDDGDDDGDEEGGMAAKARDEGLGDSYFQRNGHATAAAAARHVSVSEKSRIQRGNSNGTRNGRRDTQTTATTTKSKKKRSTRGRYSGYSYESGGSDGENGDDSDFGSSTNRGSGTVRVATAVNLNQYQQQQPQYPSRLPLPTHAAHYHPTGAWGAAWVRGPGLPPANQPPPPPQLYVPEVRITCPQPTLASPLHSNPPSAGLGGPWAGSGGGSGSTSPVGSVRGSTTSGGEYEWPPASAGGRQFIPYRKGSLAGSLYG